MAYLKWRKLAAINENMAYKSMSQLKQYWKLQIRKLVKSATDVISLLQNAARHRHSKRNV